MHILHSLDAEISPWWDDTFYEQGTQALVDTFTFTFMHLADAFIQSDLQCIIHGYTFFYQYVCSLGIEPTTFALLTQCSTTEPQEHTMDLVQRILSQTEYHLSQAQVETNLAQKTAKILSSSSTVQP